jgi:uncharacterized protein
MHPADIPKFIVDINVGKLAKWLRMIGYDTLLFDHRDDSRLVYIAVKENRILLTRDTQLMKRRIITTGELEALLIINDNPVLQIHQVINTFSLDLDFSPFRTCLECNEPLVKCSKQDIENRVPPYVFHTQNQFVECPLCHRIYWQGTHWQAMKKKLSSLS